MKLIITLVVLILSKVSIISSKSLCGSSVDGQDPLQTSWPWLVALLDKQSEKFFCSGVLISQNMVLTVSYEQRRDFQ